MAIQEGDAWKPAIKISESREKTPTPGNKRLWRIYDERGQATADLMTLDDEDPTTQARLTLRHPSTRMKRRLLERSQISQIEALLVDVWVEGKLVYDLPDVEAMRALRRADVDRLDSGVRRLINPHVYHVSLSQQLWDLKDRLIESLSVEE